MDKNNVEKIVVLRYEHIGDYGLTIPQLLSLKLKFPKAKIDVVIGPWNEELARITPGLNKIILFDNPLVKRHIKYTEIIKIILFEFTKILDHIKELNKENYDILIDFSDRKFSLVLDKLIKAKKKVLGTKYPYQNKREVERMTEMLSKELGVIKAHDDIKLKYLEYDKKIIKKILQKKEIKDKKLILINPISPLKEKDWPKQKWIKMIKILLREKKDPFFLVIGDKKQKKEIDKFIKEINNKRVESIAGKINIPQFILLVEKSNMIIGGDSGPVHLTELTNTPIITLYGPTDEKRWGPPEGQGVYIKEGNSIEKISVKKVLKEVKKFYKRNS